jgi:hypothetical protein
VHGQRCQTLACRVAKALAFVIKVDDTVRWDIAVAFALLILLLLLLKLLPRAKLSSYFLESLMTI